jgi:ribosomal protein L32
MKAALKAHRAAEAKPTSEQRRRAKRAGRLLDADAASELQRESDRRTSMLGNKARADRERKAKAEVKAKELKAVALGKRPFFAKQSVLKEAVLTKQYDELKKSGKLGAALAERRKRRATKQRKWMPLSRTERGGGGGGDE